MHNGEEDPLDVYLAGQFEAWQCRQTRRNFDRPWVLSLIATSQRDLWLFAGLYRSGPPGPHPDGYWYPLALEASTAQLKGRLLVHFSKRFRATYLLAEQHAKTLAVAELRADPLTLTRFPGYRHVMPYTHWSMAPLRLEKSVDGVLTTR